MAINNYRYADLAPEFELDFVRRKPQERIVIKPLETGATLPSFQLHKKNVIAPGDTLRTLNGTQEVTQLIEGPIVLAFHSIHWNDYGNKLLEDLRDIYADLRVAGAQLLVATTDDKQTFDYMTARYQLPFATIFDQHNQIASKAGIYSATDPIWDRVAGVEADVPVPAIFVLSHSLKVLYSSVDKWFDQPFSKTELLNAVYDATHENITAIAI